LGEVTAAELAHAFRRHGPNGPDAALPLPVARASGARVFDADGSGYLDFSSGAAAPLGHSHPGIVAALAAAGQRVAVPGIEWPETIELMALLAEVVPGGTNRRVLVMDSGREALARAVGLAQRVTGRHRVAYLDDITTADVALPADCAALVANPFDARLPAARAACDAAGVLLVDDETGIGPGLTGAMLAIEKTAVRADLYVLGRGWAAGLAFGACVTGSSRMHWDGQPAANPLGCVAALTTVRLLKAGLIEQGMETARHFEKGLHALVRSQSEGTFSGDGLVWTMLVSAGKVEGFVARARKRGLLLLESGRAAVGLRPPLIAGPADIDEALAVIGAVTAEVKG
jgi:acetylornithine/N-succinyldiaminopimelate aminotransferase